jgi:signal transduction histidine kinase
MVFHLDVPEAGPDVPADHAIALFRMAQEALQNVLRHSGARNAWVSLALDGSVLTLRVEDDGKGITPEEVRSEKSTGLAGMQERALALGGELSVGTSDEGGTVVEAVVPLRPLRIETRSRRDQAPEDPGVPDPDPEEPNT